MTDLDRRSIITSLLASLGLTAALPAERLLAFAQSSPSARPHRIDVHHHFAPPAWVSEVKGRPLLQAANTTWTPEKSIEDDVDRGGVAAAIVSVTNPGLWFGDKAVTSRPGARVQRLWSEAGRGPSDSIRPLCRPAAS